jgi:PAS domain S-box-containing protein
MSRVHRLSMRTRFNMLFQNTLVRYLFGIIAIAITFVLRMWFVPVTGTGTPFVLFFTAILATSLIAGVGPGICAVVLSLPLASYIFVTRAGYPIFQAVFESLLFTIDGVVVVFLTFLMKKGRQAIQEANRQLRSANEEITRSMARIRQVIELAPDAFFQADLNAHFTDVNQAACRMLGYDRNELLGKTIFDIIPAEDAPRLMAVRADLLALGRMDRAEWTQIRKDGSFVPVEVSSNILPDGRWQAFVRDISERKRIEDERQVFVSFLENSPDFIGIADPAGKPVYINPAGRRMVGLPPDYPVENTQIPEYYSPDQRAFASDVIVPSMIEQGRWHGETYFRHWQTQQAIAVSDEHFVIRHPGTGRILGMGTITRDISDARRIAAELEQLLASEQLVRRQAETANEQLRESEEKYRALFDSIDEGFCVIEVLFDDAQNALD